MTSIPDQLATFFVIVKAIRSMPPFDIDLMHLPTKTSLCPDPAQQYIVEKHKLEAVVWDKNHM